MSIIKTPFKTPSVILNYLFLLTSLRFIGERIGHGIESRSLDNTGIIGLSFHLYSHRYKISPRFS